MRRLAATTATTALLAACACAAAARPAAEAPDAAFDCAARGVVLALARAVQPARSAAELQLLADALAGSPQFGPFAPTCNISAAAALAAPAPPTWPRRAALPPRDAAGAALLDPLDAPLLFATPPPLPPPQQQPQQQQQPRSSADSAVAVAALVAAATYYADAVAGSDANSGSLASPFRTLHRAVAAARAGPAPAAIFLRNGTYYFGEEGLGAITLGAADSGLSIASFAGEAAWLSGGLALPPAAAAGWRAVDTSGSRNIWATSLVGAGVSAVPGLRLDGARLTRARFPNNADETTFGPQISPTWIAPDYAGEALTVQYAQPSRAGDAVEGILWQTGVGGGCSAYDPPLGFFCGNLTGRFTANLSMPRWPKGMVAPPSMLPNSPYKNATGAVVHAWRGGGWFTRMHLVGGVDAASGTFLFSGGGFQGHEGEDGGGGAFIENVREELDAPAEWHYDESSGLLTLFHNASTGVPPPPAGFVLLKEKVLLNISGAANVSLLNLGFRDAALTYLDSHSLPSSGDWALARTAAVFLEDTDGALVSNCTFLRLDGVALMLSGRNRGAEVSDSHFAFLGESAIALWGRTSGGPLPGSGPDTRGGEQPRFTRILRNIFREFGLFEKQSSAYFRAEAGLTSFVGNWVFNGPRAGINLNDGALGGDLIDSNVIANQCRESGDHGPINSWDRAAYFNDLRNGTTSAIKLTDAITRNAIIANYQSQTAVDNDDSSAHFLTASNFLLYGNFGLKSDFGGHSNAWNGNVVAFPTSSAYWCTWGFQLAGVQNAFTNNIVALSNDGDWTQGLACDPGGAAPAWVWRQGYLPEGGDILPPQRVASIDAAKAVCEATIGCWALSYQPGEPDPSGEVYVYFKSMGDAPFGNACCGTWTYNVSYGSTIVYNNSYISPTGNVSECGLPLAQWQQAHPGVNDVGSTASAYSPGLTDALISAARTVLGL